MLKLSIVNRNHNPPVSRRCLRYAEKPAAVDIGFSRGHGASSSSVTDRNFRDGSWFRQRSFAARGSAVGSAGYLLVRFFAAFNSKSVSRSTSANRLMVPMVTRVEMNGSRRRSRIGVGRRSLGLRDYCTRQNGGRMQRYRTIGESNDRIWPSYKKYHRGINTQRSIYYYNTASGIVLIQHNRSSR